MSAAVTFLTLCAVLATGLAAVRLVRGPGHADRVVALDIFLASAVVLAVAAALHTGRHEFLDVGIGLALVGFVGTLSLARLVEQGRGPRRGPDGETRP